MYRIYSWAVIGCLMATGCQFQKENRSNLSLGKAHDETAANPSAVSPTVFQKTEKTPDSETKTVPSSQVQPIKEKQSFAESFLFQPAKYPKGFQGLKVEGQRVEFKSEDGTELDGQFFRDVDSKQMIVFCHGNGGNLGSRAPRMGNIQKRHQVAVFIFDYRGYGRSQGKPTISGVLADGRAAVRKAAELGNMSPSEVIVMGRSLGGAIAIQLAQEFNSKGLIVESSFTSFKDVAKYHVGMLSLMTKQNDLNSESTIKDYRGKVLVSHGTKDRVVPFDHGQRLFAAANQPKQFYKIEGGGHNDAPPERYEQILEEFLKGL